MSESGGSDRASDPFVGTSILGQFEIIEVIGEGAMGRVYRAYQRTMDRHVAVKIVRIGDTEMRSRFRNEARTISRLVHPNIITVYNFGELAEGPLFLAMEYVQGQTLGTFMNGAPLQLKQAVNIAYQCAQALECAHDAEIIHRDLKPENIMIMKVAGRDHVKILDFGIAHCAEQTDITPNGLVIGTPQYMSPEQCRGEVATPASDQYALGLVLYEMLSGKPAFFADHLVAYLLLQQQAVVPPLARDRHEAVMVLVDSIIKRMTAKDPAARFSCMRDVQSALESIEQQPHATGKPSAAQLQASRPPEDPVAAKRSMPRVAIFGKGQPFRSDGRETILDSGFEVVARSEDVKDLGVPRQDSDLWVVRTSDDKWHSIAAKLRASGVRSEKTLVAIDAPIESHNAVASIARVNNVVIGRHPADSASIGVALRWMQRREASLIEAIASRGVQRIQVAAPHLKSGCIDMMLEDLTAKHIREPAKRAVRSVSEEMIMNAIFHAPVDADGTRVYAGLDRGTAMNLSEREQPLLQWAIGDRTIAVSIRDRFGSLESGRVIAALSPASHVNVNARLLTAGWGISIMSRAARHLFFGIVPGEFCEVLALIEREPAPDSFDKRSLCVLQRPARGEEKIGDRLWIRETHRNDAVHIEMRGEINETSDLRLIFQRTGDIRIDLAGVAAINSSGVLAWMNAHRSRNKSVRLVFERCSPPIVNQVSMIRDLLSSGEVVSVQLPYFCGTCEKEVLTVLDTRGTKLRQIPVEHCPRCNRELEFSEIPELYLGFLTPR